MIEYPKVNMGGEPLMDISTKKKGSREIPVVIDFLMKI